jgi:hypothetical protein
MNQRYIKGRLQRAYTGITQTNCAIEERRQGKSECTRADGGGGGGQEEEYTW